MENNKLLVFIGAFLFTFSIILIILAVLFAKQIDKSITVTQNTYPEALIGWFGATIVGGGIALRMYMNSSGGSGYGMGSDEAGDSVVSFVGGLSIALFALVATWLVIVKVPTTITAISLVSTVFAFVGLVMVAYFATQSE